MPPTPGTKPRPLTGGQHLLAADPKNVALAIEVARAYARKCRIESQFEDLHSAALMGLCQAARDFDPARGLEFATFAQRRIAGAVIDYTREMMPKGYRRAGHGARRDGGEVIKIALLSNGVNAPGDDRTAELADTIAAGELPVGWEIESEDEVDALARKLPAAHGETVRLFYTRCPAARMKGVGRILGLSESRVSQRLTESVRMLRGEDPTTEDEAERARQNSRRAYERRQRTRAREQGADAPAPARPDEVPAAAPVGRVEAMTARDILTKHLAEAEARAATIRGLLAEIDALPPTAPLALAAAPPAVGPKPTADRKKPGPKPGAATPDRADLPAVAKLLGDGPKPFRDMMAPLHFTPSRLGGLLRTFGPEANGHAYFVKDGSTWALTPLGRKELLAGES